MSSVSFNSSDKYLSSNCSFSKKRRIAIKSSREFKWQNPSSRITDIVLSFIQRNRLARLRSKSLYTSNGQISGLPSNTLPEPPNTSINLLYLSGNSAYKICRMAVLLPTLDTGVLITITSHLIRGINCRQNKKAVSILSKTTIDTADIFFSLYSVFSKDFE